MTQLYIIRHAEAEGNVYRRIHGQYDALVTPNGLKQIEALKKRFEGVHLDAVYASDLYRTRKTAQALYVPRGLTLITRPGLRELNMGVWEDLTWSEAALKYPEQFAVFMNEPWRFSIAGGESMQELTERIYRAVCEIADENPGKTVAIVTHGMAIRALMRRLEGLGERQLREIGHSDNTAVALVEVKPERKFHVVYREDNSHLGGGLSTFANQKWWRTPQDGDAASGMREINLLFRPAQLPEQNSLVEAFRRDAWQSIHGSLAHYDAQLNLAQAARMARADERAVVFAENEGDIAGIIQLDVEERIDPGAGHIAFVYLKDAYRGRRLGVQLIGHAVSVYRQLGRRQLRLRVAPYNERAVAFYEKLGFYPTGEETGMTGKLLIMKKDIFLD